MINYKDLDDNALMLLYVKGEYDAFLEIYKRYSGQMYGYFVKRMRRKETSEELLQLAFLKIHKSKDSFSVSFKLSTWIFTICRNTLIDFVRASKKMQFLDIDSIPEISEELEEDNHLDTDVNKLLKDSKLSSDQKEILELRFVKELSYEDIASRFDISLVLARKRVSRAIQSLKQKLSKADI